MLLLDLHLSIPSSLPKTSQVCLALVAWVHILFGELRRAPGIPSISHALILVDPTCVYRGFRDKHYHDLDFQFVVEVHHSLHSVCCDSASECYLVHSELLSNGAADIELGLLGCTVAGRVVAQYVNGEFDKPSGDSGK